MHKFIDDQINAIPLTTANGNIVLRDGRRSRILMKNNELTKAGEYYEEKSGKKLESDAPEPYRKGQHEFAMINGREKRLRTWDPALDKWVKYTKAGILFYDQKRVEVVVHVPVNIKGKRSNGTNYDRVGWMPVSDITSLSKIYVRDDLTETQRADAVKIQVLEALPEPILEVSGETWTYNDEATWRISSMTTKKTGEAFVTNAVMNRPLRVNPISTLSLPDNVIPEAFEDKGNCVPRQLGAVLDRDWEVLVDELDEVQKNNSNWTRDDGFTMDTLLQWCKLNQYAIYIYHGTSLIEKHVPLEKKRTLACSVLANHVYFMKKPTSTSKASGQRLRRAIMDSSVPDFSEWQPFDLEKPSPHMYSVNLEDVRAALLRKGIHPKLVMASEILWKRLRTKTFTVHLIPENANEIKNWLGALGLNIEYRGEGLPNMTLKVITALLKRKRVFLTDVEKNELLVKCGNKCEICDDPLNGEVEFDHVVPLSSGFGDQTFQCLCPACHASKTQHESRDFDNPLLSHFSPPVWKAYVESEKIPPIVYKARAVEGSGLILDVKRCRRSALYNSAHDFSVYSPTDSIEDFRGVVGDLNYVTRKYKGFELQLSYLGPGFYHKVAVEWWLHSGVITLNDISHVLNATGHLPKDIFRESLDKMQQAWKMIGEDHLDKFSVNAMIGLFFKDESYGYTTFSSPDVRDQISDAKQTLFKYEGGAEYDWVKCTKLINSTTFRPILDQILSTECVRMGQAIYILKRLGIGRNICEYKTDSILFTPHANRRKKAIYAFEELRHCDLNKLRDRYEGKNRRLDDYIRPSVDGSETKIFRIQEAIEEDEMRSEPARPCRKCDLNYSTPRWTTLTEDQAKYQVLNNESSLLVIGNPGVGKSHLLKELTEQLKTSGYKISIVSKTHVASSRIGGVTADHFSRRYIDHGTCQTEKHYIWIDEISQIDIALLASFNRLAHTNVKWLISGDWNQFGPICNTWRGTIVPEDALEKSSLLYHICDGKVLYLHECRRSSADLFNFYCEISLWRKINIQDWVRRARARFPVVKGHAEHNLCLSHHRRIHINKIMNLAQKPTDAVFIKAVKSPGSTMKPQNMWVYPGQTLIANIQKSTKLRNGVRYKVVSVGEMIVLDNGACLNKTDCSKYLRLSHAITFAACQGDEFQSVRLWDCGSIHFTWKHLYVGMSRAKETVEIV